MKLKLLFWLLITVLLITAPPLEAQQPGKVARIGYVSSSGTATSDSSFAALRQGLLELGHAEGKDIRFEYRSAEGEPDRIPGLVAELVQLKVYLLFCPNLPAINAAKQATNCHGL